MSLKHEKLALRRKKKRGVRRNKREDSKQYFETTINHFQPSSHTFFLKPEAYEKHCKGCEFEESHTRHRKLVAVTCKLDRCIYETYDEIWQRQ